MSYLSGENVGSLLDHVNIELDRLIADESWETALVVLHGGVNRAILSRAITGTPVFLGRLEQTPGCINILDHGPDWFVCAVNVIPDNPAHVGPRELSLEEIADAYRAYRGYPVPGPR
jgi:broad specificity phosphatase PhoE